MNTVFDYFLRKEVPQLILCTPNKSPVASLGSAYNIKNSVRFNALGELEFYFPQSINNGETLLSAYALIKNKMLVYVEDVGYYIIKECPVDSNGSIPVKRVLCDSLEAELLTRRVTNFKTDGVALYADDSSGIRESLLQFLIDQFPGWSIGYIDPDLLHDTITTPGVSGCPIMRGFDVNNTTIYKFLTDDVQKAYDCVFAFDTINKVISASAVRNLGIATDVYISFNNLAEKISLTEYSDEMATALYCYGEDGLDIHSVNPLGDNIIYNFDYYLNTSFMGQDLIDTVNAWKVKTESKEDTFATLMTNMMSSMVGASGSKTDLTGLELELAGMIEVYEAEKAAKHDLTEISGSITNQYSKINTINNTLALIEKNIVYMYAQAKVIVNGLEFTRKENLNNFYSEIETSNTVVKKMASQWKTTYSTTSLNPSFSINQFTSACPTIEGYFTDIQTKLSALLEDTGNEIIAYPSSDYTSLANDTYYSVGLINKLCASLSGLIPNTNIIRELTRVGILLQSYYPALGYKPDKYYYFDFVTNKTGNPEIEAIIAGCQSSKAAFIAEINSFIAPAFTVDQFERLNSFIYENTYTNDNIGIYENTDVDFYQAQARKLYNQGKTVIERLSKPRFEIDGNFVNFLSLPEYSKFSEEIELGKKVTVEISGSTVEVALLEIEYTYDKPDSFNLVFSNKVRLNNSNFIFADMFGLSAEMSSGTTSDAVKTTNSPAFSPKLASGTPSSGKTVTTTNIIEGIDSLNNTSSPNVAGITTSTYVAFGVVPPKKYGNNEGIWLGYDGGSKASFYSNANNYFQWDGTKLLVNAANFTLDMNGNITAHNVDLSGSIVATQGKVGGWLISTDSLTSGTGTDRVGMDVSSGSPRIYAGSETANSAPFRVYSDGRMYASNAEISGSISATSGSIGGWGVTSSCIVSSSGSTGMISSGDYAFFAGDTNPENAEFSVTHTGKINATSGSIGGNKLDATSIGSPDFITGLLGKGWKIENTGKAEFQDITARGVIRTSVFEKDTISAINGIVLISKADVLDVDMTALDTSTLTIKGETTFVNNEIIRIKDGTDDEWMIVTDNSSAPTYTVIRDIGNNGVGSYNPDDNPTWTKGTAVVSMGVGDGIKTGYVLLDSSSASSPYIDVYGRNGTSASDVTIHGRYGYLGGIIDSDVGLNSTDVWGLYTDNAYIKGTVVASSGSIGGWDITETTIESGGISLDSSSSSIHLGKTITGSLSGTGTYINPSVFRVGNPSRSYLIWDGDSMNTHNASIEISGSASLSHISIGALSPSGSSSGTGMWIDSSGLYTIKNDINQITIDNNGILKAGEDYISIGQSGIDINGTLSNIEFFSNGSRTGRLDTSSENRFQIYYPPLPGSNSASALVSGSSFQGGIGEWVFTSGCGSLSSTQGYDDTSSLQVDNIYLDNSISESEFLSIFPNSNYSFSGIIFKNNSVVSLRVKTYKSDGTLLRVISPSSYEDMGSPGWEKQVGTFASSVVETKVKFSLVKSPYYNPWDGYIIKITEGTSSGEIAPHSFNYYYKKITCNTTGSNLYIFQDSYPDDNDIVIRNTNTGESSVLANGTGFSEIEQMICTDNFLYVTGYFTKINNKDISGGISANRIARYSEGEGWDSLQSGLDESGYCFAHTGNKKTLYVGGAFNTAGGVSASKIAKWDENTETWEALGSGLAYNTPYGAGNYCYDLAYNSSGSTLYAGGTFVTAGGVSASKIAKWDENTEEWEALGSGLNGTCISLAYSPSGSILYVGGAFSRAGGMSASGLAKWEESTETWSVIEGIKKTGTAPYVTSLGYDSIKKYLYVIGVFDKTGDFDAENFGIWDESTQDWLSPNIAHVGYSDTYLKTFENSGSSGFYIFNTRGGIDITEEKPSFLDCLEIEKENLIESGIFISASAISVSSSMLDVSNSTRISGSLTVSGSITVNRGASSYVGTVFVPFISNDSLTILDGSDTLSSTSGYPSIDLTTRYGVPAEAKAISAVIWMRDNASATSDAVRFSISASATSAYDSLMVFPRGSPNNVVENTCAGIVPCVTSGSTALVYHNIVASGTNTAYCLFRITGYWI